MGTIQLEVRNRLMNLLKRVQNQEFGHSDFDIKAFEKELKKVVKNLEGDSILLEEESAQADIDNEESFEKSFNEDLEASFNKEKD